MGGRGYWSRPVAYVGGIYCYYHSSYLDIYMYMIYIRMVLHGFLWWDYANTINGNMLNPLWQSPKYMLYSSQLTNWCSVLYYNDTITITIISQLTNWCSVLHYNDTITITIISQLTNWCSVLYYNDSTITITIISQLTNWCSVLHYNDTITITIISQYCRAILIILEMSDDVLLLTQTDTIGFMLATVRRIIVLSYTTPDK